METFAEYLLKSVAWLTGFALVYLLFLRNERFFQLKRIYLLTGIIFSLAFPLISIHYQVDVQAPAAGGISFPENELSGINPVTVTAAGIPVDYKLLLFAFYISGMLFLGFRIIQHLMLIRKTLNRAVVNNMGSARLVRISSLPASFSFFNYVFINPSVDEAEVREIMNHELVHVKQKHWLDLMLVEFLRLFQWINPFVWIYTRYVRQNNEYLADELALQRSSNPGNYKAALMNQLFSSPVFSLTNSFNYSLNKKRFDMMKKITASPYRKMKVLMILPVVSLLLWAFSTPEYNYSTASEEVQIENQVPDINNGNVKGVVLKEDGTPFAEVSIVVTGTQSRSKTDSKGNFALTGIPENSFLVFSIAGYKTEVIKPVFIEAMTIRLVKDPDYKPGPGTNTPGIAFRPQPLVVVDGVISDKSMNDVSKELVHEIGMVNSLFGKEATDKYGDKAANGIIEITTRKKALELGLKPRFTRVGPDDYPTFQGQRYTNFRDWVISRVEYPAEASSLKAEGFTTVNFNVELDGTISNIIPAASANPILANEIIRIIKSAPQWDPPKNPYADQPFAANVTVNFRLPDRIVPDEPFVVVEQMPMYPGGDGELLRFIAENTTYPEAAKAEKAEGRVILRFVVTTEGNTDGISVLKGVHPLLDAEAIRVVSMVKGFTPGMQGGKPVNVWYMVPITFTLNKTETPQ